MALTIDEAQRVAATTLGRELGQDELRGYLDPANGAGSADALRSTLASSREGERARVVRGFYQEYLGRDPLAGQVDPGFADYARGGMDLGSIQNQIINSDEKRYNETKRAETAVYDALESQKEAIRSQTDIAREAADQAAIQNQQQYQLQERALGLSEQQLADNRQYAAELMAISRENLSNQRANEERYFAIADAQLGIQSELAADYLRQAGEYETRMKSTFYPVEDSLVAESMGYYDVDAAVQRDIEDQIRNRGLQLGRSAEEISQEIAGLQSYASARNNSMEQAAGRAAQDVASQFAQQRGLQARQLASVGVDATSGRAMAVNNSNNILQAASSAQAQNQARNVAKQLGFAQRLDTAAIGRNLPGFSSNAMSGALAASQSQSNTAAQGSQVAGNFGAGAASIFGAGAGLSNQGFANSINGFNAGSSFGNQALQNLGASSGLFGNVSAGNASLGAGFTNIYNTTVQQSQFIEQLRAQERARKEAAKSAEKAALAQGIGSILGTAVGVAAGGGFGTSAGAAGGGL